MFLQKIVNPQSEIVFQDIKAHDKVIVTENVYVDGELIASNGQMGYVVSKDMGFIGLLLPSDGDGTVLIEPKDIKLAYALTVHKFQGSESDYVIFVIPPGTDREFLTDEMVFVGTTRGGKLLCWERPEKFCHRHIVSRWLSQHLNISITELQEIAAIDHK